MSLPFSASAAGLGAHPGLFATHFQQRLPGRCLLLSWALLPGWGRDRKSAVAAQVLPCRLWGERASLLNAATWAAPRGGVRRGLSLGQRPRVASGLQLPFLHALGPGGTARGRWCPRRWVWKRLCGCCALVFLLRVCSETRSTTARVRGISAELEEKQTWVLESPGYLQSVED